MTEALTTGTDINTDESAKVTLKQKVEDWQDSTMQENINSNKDFKITEEDVRASLSSYITNGKIHFEENDANYPNGYKVVINKNNGNGGKITIEGL